MKEQNISYGVARQAALRLEHKDRLDIFNSIQRTIPLDRIRIITKGAGEVYKSWGVVAFGNVPFYFEALYGTERYLEFLQNGSFKRATTKWNPRGGEIEEADVEYIVRGLETDEDKIVQAKNKGELGLLYHRLLEENSSLYESFFGRFGNGDDGMALRMAYSCAVSSACDDKLSKMKEESDAIKKQQEQQGDNGPEKDC